jgi:hypothetical protein
MPGCVSPHCFEKQPGHRIEKIQNHSRRKNMNIKKSAITIGIVALVLTIACAALGLGESAYLSSNGQRGWSLGAAVYNALGWGAEAYRADMAQHHSVAQTQPGAQNVPNAAANGYGSRHTGGLNGGRSGHGGFVLLVVLGVAGYLFYRQRKQKQAVATAA